MLGGIGYTWEHDAHLYLKRATALHSLLPGPGDARARVAARRWPTASCAPLSIDLPAEAEPARAAHPGPRRGPARRPTRREWRAMLADAGLPRPALAGAVGPRRLARSSSWPSTRSCATARVRRDHLQVAGWVLPTIIGHGTDDAAGAVRRPVAAGRDHLVPDVLRTRRRQRPGVAHHHGHRASTAAGRSPARRCGRRWPTRPTGRSAWPAPTRPRLATRASAASWSTWRRRGSRSGRCASSPAWPCSTRSPSSTCSCPTTAWSAGRPRAGSAPAPRWPTSGCRWRRARRSARASRRCSTWPAPRACSPTPSSPTASARLVADAHAIAMLGVRTTLRALGGGQPGPEASVRKLLGVEHEQAVQEEGLALLGPAAVTGEADGRRLVRRLPRQPRPVDRRRHQRDPAQRHRRAPARPPQGRLSSRLLHRHPFAHPPDGDPSTPTVHNGPSGNSRTVRHALGSNRRRGDWRRDRSRHLRGMSRIRARLRPSG